MWILLPSETKYNIGQVKTKLLTIYRIIVTNQNTYFTIDRDFLILDKIRPNYLWLIILSVHTLLGMMFLLSIPLVFV